MTNTHSYKNVAWIDMISPTEDDIMNVVKRYSLHPLVGEELRSNNTLAKLCVYDEYALIVLTVPTRVNDEGSYKIVDREIDFILGKNFMITSRTNAIDSIEYFAKILDTNNMLGKDEKIEHAGHLFYFLLKRLYQGMIDDIENIKDALVRAESLIFKGNERKMVEVLSTISREVIDFRQTTRIHRDVWDEMLQNFDRSFFGKDFTPYVRSIKDEFNKINELLLNTKELLVDLRETNDSLLNTKQNEIVRILTLASFIFLPLTFIASLFTIPGIDVPMTTERWHWYVILGIMILISVFTIFKFKKMKWM
jgi:magnesium transporter